MADFFNWLAGGSTSSLLFIIVVATIGISLPFVYLIAFFQGRSISFWPPTIGQKPSKDQLLEDKKIKSANINHNEYQGFKLIDSFEDLINENLSIVRNAKEILVITGSRSRDVNYLQTIEQKIVSTPNLRVLQNKKPSGFAVFFSGLPLTFWKNINTMAWDAQKPAKFGSHGHCKVEKLAAAIKFSSGSEILRGNLAASQKKFQKNPLNHQKLNSATLSNLTHIRILLGMPHHQFLKNHLLNLIKIKDPYNRSSGKQKLFIGLFDDFIFETENFICANENTALVVLPSINGAGNYDTALIFNDPKYVKGLIQYAREIYNSSKPLDRAEEIKKLPVVRMPNTPAKGA